MCDKFREENNIQKNCEINEVREIAMQSIFH